MEAPNVLLLDEPTNDLDVMTLSILEDYLQGFPGPILIVSHDRFLLDKLAEQVFEVRDGEVLRYSGNWSDWKAKRKEKEAPAKVEKPKAAQERPRERKLKFSFKEQREFETIDADLGRAGAADPGVRGSPGGLRQRLCAVSRNCRPSRRSWKPLWRKKQSGGCTSQS